MTTIHFISLPQIDAFRFSVGAHLSSVFNLGPTTDTPLISSLDYIGIQVPLLVVRDASVPDKVFLVDGFKRFLWATNNDCENIPCLMMPDDCSLDDVLKLILTEQRESIQSSAASRASGVAFLLKQGILQTDLPEFAPYLDIAPHKNVFRQYIQVSELPNALLSFCHIKQFSLKQCVAMTRFDDELIREVIAWQNDFQLSASTVLEFLEFIHDDLKRHAIDLTVFKSMSEVKSILSSAQSPSQKTVQMRAFLKARRHPILTSVNQEILSEISTVKLPDDVSLTWDQTLENKGVSVILKVEKEDRVDPVLNSLSDDTFKKVIFNILEKQ